MLNIISRYNKNITGKVKNNLVLIIILRVDKYIIEIESRKNNYYRR